MFSRCTAIRALAVALVYVLSAPSVHATHRVFLDPGEDAFRLPYRLIIEDKLDYFADGGEPTGGFWKLYRASADGRKASYQVINRWKSPGTSAAVVVYKDIECIEALWHYNLPAPSVLDCRAFDVDADGIDEIANLYRLRDTIWLEILNVTSKTSHRVPLSTGVDRDDSGEWDASAQFLDTADTNLDNLPELFINVDVGYDLYPRELLCFSPKVDSCLWRFEISGIIAGGNFHVTRLSPNGPLRIVVGVSSKGNAAVVGDMDDLHSYLIVLDSSGHQYWRQAVGPAFSTALPVITDVDSDGNLEILVPVRGARDVRQVPLPDTIGSLCLFSETGHLIAAQSLSGTEPRWPRRFCACSETPCPGRRIFATMNDGSLVVFDDSLKPIGECFSSGPLDFLGRINILGDDDSQFLMSTGDLQLFLTNRRFELLASLPIQGHFDPGRFRTIDPDDLRPSRVLLPIDRGRTYVTISARSNSWITVFNRHPWLAFLAAFLPLALLLAGSVIAWQHAKSANRTIMRQQDELATTLADMEEVKDKLRAAEQLREARSKLHIQEENFRTIVENSLQGIIVCQGDSICHANKRIAELAGTDTDTLQSMTVREAIQTFICPEYHETILADHAAIDEGRLESKRTEIRIRTTSGKTYWLDLFSHAANYEGRRSVVVMMVDISLRKEALNRLQESELSATAMLNATSEMAALFDTDCRIIRVNKALQELLGKSEQELIGTYLLAGLPPEIERHRLQNLNRLIQTGEQIDFEDSFGGHNYSHTGYPIKNSLGEIVGVAGFSKDVTEQYNHLNELRQLRAAVEQSISGIAIADTDGYLSYVNRAWAGMHGYEPEELIGQHLQICHSPEQLADEVVPFNLAVLSRGSQYGPIGHLHRSGRPFPTLMSSTLIKDDRGQVFGMVGTAVDVTDQHNLEFELKKKTRHLQWLSSQLIRLQESDRNLIARELHDSVAHQLSVAKMLVERLRIENCHQVNGGLFEQLADTITETMREIRQLSSDLRPRMMDTLGLIATMEWYLSKLPADLDVRFDIRGSDANMNQELAINLYRIFQEMVLNVTRHANASRLTVSLKIDDSTVRLDFVDNGCGFDLSQVTDDWERKQNFGILNITERVQMVGGTIKIDTSPGLGTHFSIETPLTGGSTKT